MLSRTNKQLRRGLGSKRRARLDAPGVASLSRSEQIAGSGHPADVAALDAVSISRRGRLLLSELTLDVRRGETLAVMGPSGAGKTTLVRAIAGLTPVTSGTIRRVEGRVAMVFQDARLLPWRTAIENVEFVLDRDDRATAMLWLERVGLADAAHVYPGSLSGGMRQRVSIARALACSSPLVLVDEPFSHLDATTAAALREDLSGHLRQAESTVIWITHDPDEASAVADRTLEMAGPPTGEWSLTGVQSATEPTVADPAYRAPQDTHDHRRTR